jgi:mono/diheme cytochrome c family protein
MGAPPRFLTVLLPALGVALGLVVGDLGATERPDVLKASAALVGPFQSTLASGQAMFSGNQGPVANMPGHSSTLPAVASRCSNCHEDRQKATALDGQARAFAPPLTSASLTQTSSRRGGPPMRYDAASFCKLLREGVDPTWIVINTAMPRYRASDAQCSALWSYLMTRTPGQGS